MPAELISGSDSQKCLLGGKTALVWEQCSYRSPVNDDVSYCGWWYCSCTYVSPSDLFPAIFLEFFPPPQVLSLQTCAYQSSIEYLRGSLCSSPVLCLVLSLLIHYLAKDNHFGLSGPLAPSSQLTETARLCLSSPSLCCSLEILSR